MDRTGWHWLGFWIAWAAVGQVHAQATPAPAVDQAAVPGYTEAIGEAVAHYSARRWAEAHVAFARAHALAPSARTLRGLGLAAYYLGDHAAAREAFERALADERKALTEDQRREIAALLPICARETGRFELRVVPASARVEVNGEVIERRVLFMKRGEHALAVSAEGHVPQHATLHVTGGEDRALAFALPVVRLPATAEAPKPSDATLEPVPETASAPRAATGPQHPAPRAQSSGRVFTWVAASAVPVFAATAAVVWRAGDAERDAIAKACARERCDDAEVDRRSADASLGTYEMWTNASLAASGLALAAAVVLFVVEGEPEGGGSELSATGSGAALGGTF